MESPSQIAKGSTSNTSLTPLIETPHNLMEPLSLDTNFLPYIYSPIDAGNEIRIIELLPSTAEDHQKISCHLLTAMLSDKPSYEALSYVWGEKIFPEMLHLEGRIIPITSNLAAALRQMRYPDRSRWLWADAVCINQQDSLEKGKQVALMGKIYANTEGVLAWLGQGDEDTHTAIEAVREIACRSSEFGIKKKHLVTVATSQKIGSKSKVAFTDLHHTLNFASLNRFFALDWFHRTWIMQEIALPPCIHLYCGSDTLKWSNFEAAMAVFLVLYRLRSRKGGFGHEFVRCWKLVVLRRSTQNLESLKPRTILQVVEDGIGSRCSDDRDRIYGLLGLQKHEPDVSIVGDYSRTVEEIYREFAFRHLQKGDLNILFLAGMDGDIASEAKHSSTIKLPTWVPDWRYNGYQSRYSFIWPLFAAATKLRVSIALGEQNIPFLGIKGTVVDYVQKERSTFSPFRQPTEGEMRKVLIAFYQKCIEAELGSKSLLDSGVMDTAFAKTLVMDCRTLEGVDLLESRTLPSDLQLFWEEFKVWDPESEDLSNKSSEEFRGPRVMSPNARAYSKLVHQIGRDRNIFMTKSGLFGLGPIATRANDIVAIFDGAEAPVILRRITTEFSNTTAVHSAQVIPSVRKNIQPTQGYSELL